jgi:hypothetical protein
VFGIDTGRAVQQAENVRLASDGAWMELAGDNLSGSAASARHEHAASLSPSALGGEEFL